MEAALKSTASISLLNDIPAYCNVDACSYLADIHCLGIAPPRTRFQGDGWNEGEAFLGHLENFQVGIAAEKYNSQKGEGDIAVDDIQFVNCEPPVITGRIPHSV